MTEFIEMPVSDVSWSSTSTSSPTAGELLQKAQDLITNRGVQRDKPNGER